MPKNSGSGGLSCLIFGISFALFATRQAIPIFWSLVVGNFFFALGFGGFGLAIAHLFNRRFPCRIVLMGILACSLALYFTEIVLGDSSWRVLILAAVTVVPWTVSAVQCTQEWRAHVHVLVSHGGSTRHRKVAVKRQGNCIEWRGDRDGNPARCGLP